MKLTSFIYSLFLIIFINNLFSKDISFSGLKKLDINDLQTLSNIDLFKDEYTSDEVNSIVQDLYNSDLISDINLEILDNLYLIKVFEAKKIENIYINGNIKFSDEDLLNNLSSKQNFLFKRDLIKSDIELIKNIYLTEGFYNISVSSSFESFSEDKINLIFEIYEGDPYQISKIEFYGNKYFSDRYLIDLISSRPLGFMNFLKSGSNFIPDLFNFDKNKILSKYNEKGFFYTKINYELLQLSKSKFKLVFYIEENERLLIEEIVNEFEFSSENNEYLSFDKRLKKDLEGNNNFYDLKLIEKNLDQINQSLIDQNINSYSYQARILEENNKFYLSIYKNIEKQILVNKINIEGNSITKDKVLRSKISIEPGDYYLSYNKDKSLRRLNNLRYINSVEIKENSVNDSLDLDVIIDENKKTGNFLLAGSFSGDTGLGFAIALNDYNFAGSGNELKSSFDINTEEAKFEINYKQYLINNPSLSNNYEIFNRENDLTSSFGFKTEETGVGYSVGFNYNEEINMSFGLRLNLKENHSGINTNNYIQENIGDFNQFTLNYGVVYNTTNDIMYPTDGIFNKFTAEISPDQISDDSYYKFRLTSDLYFGNEEKNNFFFISNRLGLADSFKNNLKTTNAFSLGGLNFKGFDYRGVGPIDSGIYLGGNNFYTSTLGYGSQFLFDKKDNINFRTFITSGSIWGSDYSSNNDFKNRISAGISADILTAVFPVSFSYAIPIEKEDDDKVREFNFTIGTSFWLSYDRIW